MVGLLFVNQAKVSPSFFEFRFNAFALLSLTGVVLNLVLFYIIRRSELKSDESLWLIFFLATATIFGLAEMLQRLSATPSGAVFWAQIQGIGAGLEPVALFLFALTYMRQKSLHIATTTILILSGVLLFFFHANGGLIFKIDPASINDFPWGYNNDIGPAYFLNALWVFLLLASIVILFIRYRSRTSQVIIRQQTMLYLIAALLPIVSALLTDVFAPAVGWQIPPLHGFFVAGTSALIIYGMSHYHVFSISPSLLSQEVLNNMKESVVVLDQALTIKLMNQEAEKLLATPEGKGIEKNLLDYFDESNAFSLKTAIQKIGTEVTTATVDNLVVSQADHATYVRVSASQVTGEHGIPGYILVFADVTELKHSYDALDHEKANVEQTVQVRTQELQKAQAKLKETDKIKTEFVMLTSHNLRTPLTVIEGNVELLENTHLDENQNKMLSDLKISTKRLGVFVEDLLTISSIESGQKLTMQKVELSKVVEPLLREADELSIATHNRLEVQANMLENIWFNASESRLKAALRNVIDNAFKFTNHGIVIVTVGSLADKIIIKVQDSGIGISSKELPELFTKFHRATDTLEFNYEGKGIGLYLTKLIVEEHKGTIEVKSQEGQGTTVTIEIPLFSE